MGEQFRAVEHKILRVFVFFVCGKHAVKQAVGLIDFVMQQQRTEQKLCIIPVLVRLVQIARFDFADNAVGHLFHRMQAPPAAPNEKRQQQQSNA